MDLEGGRRQRIIGDCPLIKGKCRYWLETISPEFEQLLYSLKNGHFENTVAALLTFG